MEPKTFDEYWDESCKEVSGEWDCDYIGDTKYKWNNMNTDVKLDIWANCKLDYFENKCTGRCSKYKEKEKKPWYKKLFSR